MPPTDPTRKTYDDLSAAYAFFNLELFGGRLPPCLITMQRKAKAYGYFAGTRFGNRIDGGTTDEIALNPSHFKDRTPEQTLSTLVHEMTHLEQHHFGRPSQPGGRETGQRVSHYIEAGGAFATACAALIAKKGAVVSYVELWTEGEGAARRKKAASKTKYTCPSCALNAWAKPDVRLTCGDCDEPMAAEASWAASISPEGPQRRHVPPHAPGRL